MKEKPSLLIIGNSNVGKSATTRLLLPNPKKFKGKTGKAPGSTLFIKPITQDKLPYKIVDLPGFGYMRHKGRRRAEHIKKLIVVHIEKHNKEYFFGIVVINILRIENQITKYFIKDKNSIPLNFELIQFLKEFNIPFIVLMNKIDKVPELEMKRIIALFVNSARDYGLNLIHLDKLDFNNETEIPYLEFSALKKINLGKLKSIIQHYFNLFPK